MVVKSLFLIFLILSTLNSSGLTSQIREIVGEKEYSIKKNLINVVFKNKIKFLDFNDNIDVHKVMRTLHNNSFNYKKHSYKGFVFKFLVTSNIKISIANIFDIFNEMGINYKLLKSVKNDSLFQLTFFIKNKTINLKAFENAMYKRFLYIKKIAVQSNKLTFILNPKNVIFKARKIAINRNVDLKKPRTDYILNVKNMSKITLTIKGRGNWYPYITFYDSSLNVLWTKKIDRKTKRLSLDVAKRSNYMRVTDIYNLNNISRGLSVILRAPLKTLDTHNGI